MKRLSLSILAAVAMVITGTSAFAQVHTVGDHQASRNYVGYQASDWSDCNQCQSGNCNGRHSNGNRLSRCLGEKGFPDAGWAPPVNYPVNYDGTWYAAYQPQAYYGSPGGGFIANYPTVYQPNDTTQLGYSYMKVPTWQTRRDMIPPIPQPGNFHTRGSIGGQGGCLHNGFHGQKGSTCETCNNGYVVDNHFAHQGMPMHQMDVQNMPMQMQPGQMHNSQPMVSAPSGQKSVRPVAHKQSVFSKMRFASVKEMFK